MTERSQPAAGGSSRSVLVVAVAAALIFSLPNFVYPFFEDTALYHVIGHYMRAGLLPYRDLVDQKPPAIYWVTFLTDVLMGRSSFASRLAELVAIFFMAAACAKIARAALGGAALPLGIFVTAALSSSLFWSIAERGQVEWYQAAVTAWGVWFAVESLDAPAARTLLACGAFLGLGCWFKPQGAVTALAIGLGLGVHAALSSRPREVLRRLALIAAGAAAVSALFVGWMLATGIFRQFLDVMLVTNSEYLQLSPPLSLGEALYRLMLWPWLEPSAFAVLFALTAAGLAAFVVPLSRGGSRRREWIGALVLLWLGGSFAQYLSGHFFFRYHTIIMLPAMAVILTCGLIGLSRGARRLLAGRLAPPIGKLVLGAGAALIVFLLAMNEKSLYEWTYTFKWLTGRADTSEVYAAFGSRLWYYRYGALKSMADRIRARTRPQDSVLMLGRGGTFYLYVDRRPASRYMVTNGLFDPRRSSTSERFDQFMSDLERNRPAYILIRADDPFPWFGLASSDQLVDRQPRLVEVLLRDYVPEEVFAARAYVFRRRDLAPP